MEYINTEPKPHRKKWYFAWHTVSGIPFAFAWCEDDGLPVGGIPKYVGPRVEITEEQFNNGLKDLEEEHPFLDSWVTPDPEAKPI